MLRLFALVAAALLAPGLAAASQGGDNFELRCEREMKPVLEVRAMDSSFDINNTVSSHLLNTRYRYASVSQLALGLTDGTTRSEITFDAPGLMEHGSARECVSPRIYVQLSYSPLHVFVAREFSPYSCSYRVIYAHEMQHVGIYRTEFAALRKMVQEQLVRRYGNQPLYARAGGGLPQLEHDVDGWLRPLINHELARIDALQSALDTPEESFRLSHACNGEVASLVGSSL
jgi:hypothetical protein